jgi:hypothetical protein
MVIGGGLMLIERADVTDAVPLSFTLMVKLEDPEAVGVPEIVLPERLSPAGSDPLATDQV